MLLTITCTGKQTQDLGYLLHKNPGRSQKFKLSFGNAYVFYPEVSDARTTAALLLDINPVDLARGKLGSSEGGLFDYVNDRPYVCSSFMSTALARVFGTAMKGRCEKKPELVQMPLELSACIHMLPCRGGVSLAKEIFEPLGYAVSTVSGLLDEKFPEWGESCYVDLTISGRVTLSGLLNHLYVLIPVFDRHKHYYMGEDEIGKLLDHGQGWLSAHPARDRIIARYFEKRRSYARMALDRLNEDGTQQAVEEAAVKEEPLAEQAEEEAAVKEEPLAEQAVEEETVREEPLAEQAVEKKAGTRPETLNARRLEAVRRAVLESGAASVIDLGCGECRLTAMLLEEAQIKKVTAADVSIRVLERAEQRLRPERMPAYKKNKLTLIQASLTYRDERFYGYDTACVVEVIEHLEPARIRAFERVLFEYAMPKQVILTTPNREYNVKYQGMEEGALRHKDHRFEWTREEFRAWTAHVCETFGYQVQISGIGDEEKSVGAPTQMGVFVKCG